MAKEGSAAGQAPPSATNTAAAEDTQVAATKPRGVKQQQQQQQQQQDGARRAKAERVEKEQSSSDGWGNSVVLGCVMAAAAAFLALSLQSPAHNSRQGPPPTPPQIIDRRDLSEAAFDPEDIIAMSSPVLLSSKQLESIWPVVSERLSPASLTKRKSLKEQIVPDVRIHDEGSLFVPATTKPGQVPHRLAPEAEYRYENLTVGELIAQMREPLPGRYMQATLPVQNTAIEKWTLDLEDALFVNDTQEAAAMNMPQFASTTVFWISQPGSVSNLHYDRSHNFYLVLNGAKTITLVPPSEWPFVYLYPWLHPSYHQSQVHQPQNVSHIQGVFPAYQEVQNVSITLRKGDALYIPPYWMHRVETLGNQPPPADGAEADLADGAEAEGEGEIGISLSIVSPSRDEMFYSDAYWKLKPFSEDWDTKLRVIAMHQFLDILFELLEKEMDGESATEFIQRALKRSRYSQELIRLPAERMAVPQARECFGASRISDPDTLAIFTAVALNGTKSLKELSSRHVLSISLANLIEEMFRFALGGYNMAAHLAACY